MGVKRKKRYKTVEEAQKADLNAKPYKCKICGDWHLTTKYNA